MGMDSLLGNDFLPTILSYSKRFIFIHNYKVAGMSLSKVLAQYEPHAWLHTTLRRSGVTKYYPALANFQAHATAVEVRDLVDEQIFNNFYKFAFVRNPWDWQVSLYFYMLKTKWHFQHKLVKRMSFDDYIDWRVNHDLETQCHQIADEEGKILVDFVGRFENIEEDFTKVCDHLSIPVSLSHRNRSKHAPYRDYYSPRTRQMVQDAFAEDIARFGYEF